MRPEITPARAKAIRDKRTWEARGELATWATEAQFASDLAGPLAPEGRLLALLGPAAFELGQPGRLVALCLATADWRRRQRGQDGFRAPLPVLAKRVGKSVRHTARLVEAALAAFKAAGVGVDEAPDHVRRRAACSRRGNAYALDWPPGIATRTKNVRASGTDDPARTRISAISSSAAATPCRGAAVEIMTSPCPDASHQLHDAVGPDHDVLRLDVAVQDAAGMRSASSEPEIDGPTTATAAVSPAVVDESCEAAAEAPEGASVRDLLALELADATGERATWLRNAIDTLDAETRRIANLTRKEPR